MTSILFDYPIDLHCSQTCCCAALKSMLFDYPIDLHCSQTGPYGRETGIKFDYPIDLHCSQTSNFEISFLPKGMPVYRGFLYSNTKIHINQYQ